MGFLSSLRTTHRHNVTTLRTSPLAEISGALGDLGTLLPLMIALALHGSVSLPSTLVFSGFFNVATGVVFGIPLPVQPMKAIAAEAISDSTSLRETVAAGSVTSAAVLLLSATGLLHTVTRIIPVPVIKGIQLGAGLSLIVSAGSSLLRPVSSPGRVLTHPLDNFVWALLAFLALLFTQGRRKTSRFPYALVVFVVGIAFAVVNVTILNDAGTHDATTEGSSYPHPHPGLPGLHIWRPHAALPDWSFKAFNMGIAQLPLTTLNSVIAASALASDLFPAHHHHHHHHHLPQAPSVTALGLSVAAMNLTGCWFGAMPVCHGSGGLAAQFRFGARSGASIILLGLLKILVGLLFGETLLDLLGAFPKAFLGIMVLAAALELARVGQTLNHGASDLWESSSSSSPVEGAREGISGGGGGGRAGDGGSMTMMKQHRRVDDDERAQRWNVMLVTAAGILAFRNDAVGFAAGMACHYAYTFVTWLESRGGRRPADCLREAAPLLGT